MDLRSKGHLYKKAYKKLLKMTSAEILTYLSSKVRAQHFHRAAADILAMR